MSEIPTPTTTGKLRLVGRVVSPSYYTDPFGFKFPQGIVTGAQIADDVLVFLQGTTTGYQLVAVRISRAPTILQTLPFAPNGSTVNNVDAYNFGAMQRLGTSNAVVLPARHDVNPNTGDYAISFHFGGTPATSIESGAVVITWDGTRLHVEDMLTAFTITNLSPPPTGGTVYQLDTWPVLTVLSSTEFVLSTLQLTNTRYGYTDATAVHVSLECARIAVGGAGPTVVDSGSTPWPSSLDAYYGWAQITPPHFAVSILGRVVLLNGVLYCLARGTYEPDVIVPNAEYQGRLGDPNVGVSLMSLGTTRRFALDYLGPVIVNASAGDPYLQGVAAGRLQIVQTFVWGEPNGGLEHAGSVMWGILPGNRQTTMAHATVFKTVPDPAGNDYAYTFFTAGGEIIDVNGQPYYLINPMDSGPINETVLSYGQVDVPTASQKAYAFGTGVLGSQLDFPSVIHAYIAGLIVTSGFGNTGRQQAYRQTDEFNGPEVELEILVWSPDGVASPLRLAQRNDGLALSAAPTRLGANNGPTSHQLGVSPRLGSPNTYS